MSSSKIKLLTAVAMGAAINDLFIKPSFIESTYQKNFNIQQSNKTKFLKRKKRLENKHRAIQARNNKTWK